MRTEYTYAYGMPIKEQPPSLKRHKRQCQACGAWRPLEELGPGWGDITPMCKGECPREAPRVVGTIIGRVLAAVLARLSGGRNG